MARTTWVNPNPPGGVLRHQDVVRCLSRVAPTSSPAPAGNPIVPTGWIKQIGNDGSIDTFTPDRRPSNTDADLHYLSAIAVPVVPYDTGGWPADPLRGQPGHTPQVPWAG